MELKGKEIVLGVTGGIAAYKALEVLRGLKKAGAEVTVVMTRAACEFVQPLSFQTLSNRPVATELFDLDRESRIGHVQLADQADLVLVAPCTANAAAKLRAGLAGDLLSTLLLATRAPVFLALAMNDRMWEHPATQENLGVLAERGTHLIQPEEGFLAEGRHAVGRLAEPERIVARVADYLTSGAAPAEASAKQGATAPESDALAGRRVLVTAGPTVEAIDPVRFLSNRSSGRMGFAVAEAARALGAQVTLVTGPARLPDPPGIDVQRVTTAQEMYDAVVPRLPEQDVVVLAAAVSDYRAGEVAAQKIKRAGRDTLTLELQANPDISAAAGSGKRPGQVLVVFAAESQDVEANARKKLLDKNADLVVANDITVAGAGFDSADNQVTLIPRGSGAADGAPVPLPLMSKAAVAQHILRAAAGLLGPRRS